MREELQALKEQALAELGAVTTPDELKDLRIKYLGKKGPMTEILRGMGALPAEERPKIGQIVNEVKSALETAINAKTEVLEAESLKARLANESGADYFISFHNPSSFFPLYYIFTYLVPFPCLCLTSSHPDRHSKAKNHKRNPENNKKAKDICMLHRIIGNSKRFCFD